MLRPEVAELFELTSGAVLLYVVRLGRTVDLREVSAAQAAQLLDLPGGFEWLRRKEILENNAGPAVDAAGPAQGKKKKGG